MQAARRQTGVHINVLDSFTILCVASCCFWKYKKTWSAPYTSTQTVDLVTHRKDLLPKWLQKKKRDYFHWFLQDWERVTHGNNGYKEIFQMCMWITLSVCVYVCGRVSARMSSASAWVGNERWFTATRWVNVLLLSLSRSINLWNWFLSQVSDLDCLQLSTLQMGRESVWFSHFSLEVRYGLWRSIFALWSLSFYTFLHRVTWDTSSSRWPCNAGHLGVIGVLLDSFIQRNFFKHLCCLRYALICCL